MSMAIVLAFAGPSFAQTPEVLRGTSSVPKKVQAKPAVQKTVTPQALRGSRYEAPMNIPGLEQGGFDAQSLYTVPAVKLIRRRAVLNVTQLKQVEDKVKLWLGLS